MNAKKFAIAVIAALLLTGTAFAAAQPPEGGTIATTQPTTRLTAQEAEAAALAHAGLRTAEVTDLRSHEDRDDGVPEWDVEFRQGDWEYDYSICAETGEVRRWDKEYDPEKTTSSTSKPVQSAPAATQPPVQEQRLTAEEAKDIALKHAGLSAGEVSRLKAEFDYDDGRPEYDVEFYAGGYEYDYEIHAETGKVLKWDKEWDD